MSRNPIVRIRIHSVVFLTFLSAMLAGCVPLQKKFKNGDIRPLRVPGGSQEAYHIGGIGQTIDSVRAGKRRGPVRVLTVHGMGTRDTGFSTSWQERIGRKIGLERQGKTIDVPLVREYKATVLAGSKEFPDVVALPSILRKTTWGRKGNATPLVVYYELTWAPFRDQVKNTFLGCFESRSVASCSREDARANADRRGRVNGLLKDQLLVDGFADAAIVLSPLANVVRDDLNQTMWVISREVLGSPIYRDRRCSLQTLTVANRLQTVQALGGTAFFAITHSLGSFLLLDAQERAARAREEGDSLERTGTARDSAAALAILKAFEAGAYTILSDATVFMFANQVSLLNLGRLSVACSRTVRDFRCPGIDTTRGEPVGLAGGVGANQTTYVAFNDVNDLLGFELPPYLAESGGFKHLVNISSDNPAARLPRLFKDPNGAHTHQSQNPAVIEAVANGINVPKGGGPAAELSRFRGGVLGAHFFGPMTASVTLGTLWSPRGLCKPFPHCETKESSLFAAIEPSIRAMKASAGYTSSGGKALAGTSFRASILQHWSNSDSRYAGIELGLHVGMFTGVRVGGFLPLRNNPDRAARVMVDLAIGN